MAKHLPELEQVMAGSELLAAVKRVKESKPAGKPVSAALKKKLEANGCWAGDWSKVRVADGFDASHCFNVKFFGECELGSFSAEPAEIDKGVKLSAGIYDSVVIDSVIGDNAVIYNVGVLSNYVVGPGAAVETCEDLARELKKALREPGPHLIEMIL